MWAPGELELCNITYLCNKERKENICNILECEVCPVPESYRSCEDMKKQKLLEAGIGLESVNLELEAMEISCKILNLEGKACCLQVHHVSCPLIMLNPHDTGETNFAMLQTLSDDVITHAANEPRRDTPDYPDVRETSNLRILGTCFRF